MAGEVQTASDTLQKIPQVCIQDNLERLFRDLKLRVSFWTMSSLTSVWARSECLLTPNTVT